MASSMPSTPPYIDQEARDTARKAVATAETHEILCEERWKQQRLAMSRVEVILDEIKNSVEKRIGIYPAAAISWLMALCGFLAARAFPLH